MPTTQRVEVAIIGAGFSGLGTAIHLDRAGIRDWAILERGNDIGGTWRDNCYPGAACDVASHLYSFSFDLNPDWSHVYARQAEIQAYLKRCVARYGLADRVRLNSTVSAASFEDSTGRWTLTCDGGHTVDARFLVFGVGGLKDPRYPAIPGWETFKGATMHTARWDSSAELAGRRVGCIGTGASAIQVVPELAKQAAHVSVFQRSPAWVVPRRDSAIGPTAKAAFRNIPGLMRLQRWRLYLRHESRYPLLFASDNAAGRTIERLVRWHIRREIDDAALADALTPDYRIGCKRILVSDDWYPTFNLDNVELVTQPITQVVEDGVLLADGTHVALDVLIAATGFTVDQPLGNMVVTGVGGTPITDVWGTRPRAWLGMTVPKFPNAWILMGPNTALGHNSVVVMIEAQIKYMMQALRVGRALPDGQWLDLKPGLLEGFIADLDGRHKGQVWSSGCNSWYLGRGGENFTIWPGSTVDYIRRTLTFDGHNYRAAGGG